MKSIKAPSHGRSISVDHNSSGRNVDGGSKPSLQERKQEASTGSSGSSDTVCERSPRDRVWEEVSYLLDSLERVKQQIASGTDWDPCEVDWLKERYNLCKQQALHFVLCLNIGEVLSRVTFPGEKLTYLQIASRVISDCATWELARAIEEIGLNPHERVYFKVTEGMPVERAEQILLAMVGDGDYILAGEYSEKLGVSSNSQWYKDLKKQLQKQGWVWKSKKIKGTVVQIIKGNRS